MPIPKIITSPPIKFWKYEETRHNRHEKTIYYYKYYFEYFIYLYFFIYKIQQYI